ncbi:MAG: cyclic nucleotide-binding domain-containing protein [Mariprofundaceae bacterium]|nr:cyclic nucleotide-binding domain-containing protein [Mariprofundaceae bacterium]
MKCQNYNRYPLKIQKSQSDYIYLLVEGELAINSEINGHLVLLGYLHAGGLVGESVMEMKGKRMATVIANQNCQLIRFTGDELFQAFEQHPDLLVHFLKEMMLRKHVIKLAHNSLFAKLDMDLRFIVANRLEINHFKVGSIIQSINKNAQKAKMIVNGIVHLYDQSMLDQRVYCGRLTAGNMFGVDKLFHALPTGILYVAETECEILDIDLNVIRDVMQISKPFAEKIRHETLMFTNQLTRTVFLQHQI